MPFNMQGWEWVILIVLGLLIFGGSRLAGAGKNAGRALREFKDETRQIKADEQRAQREAELEHREAELREREVPRASDPIIEAEIVESQPEKRDQA